MYRLLTERRNIAQIEKILNELGLDYTYYLTSGSWRGKREHSVAIEFDTWKYEKVNEAARRIGELNNQEAVLIQHFNIHSELIMTGEQNESEYEAQAGELGEVHRETTPEIL